MKFFALSMMLVLNNVEGFNRQNIKYFSKNALTIDMKNNNNEFTKAVSSVIHVAKMIPRSFNIIISPIIVDPWWIIREIISPFAFLVLSQITVIQLIIYFNKITQSYIYNLIFVPVYACFVILIAYIQTEFLDLYMIWTSKERDRIKKSEENKRHIDSIIKYIESEKLLD